MFVWIFIKVVLWFDNIIKIVDFNRDLLVVAEGVFIGLDLVRFW